MCSILGLSSRNDVAPTIVDSLRRMEYRGYDSVGIAVKDESKISVKKGTGKVDDVNKQISMDVLSGTIGIGHTRWATHGGVTTENAHPHMCNSDSIGCSP